jgi:hypothetical protein
MSETFSVVIPMNSSPLEMLTPWKHNPMFTEIVTIYSITFALGMITNLAAIIALATGTEKHGNVFLGSAITADFVLLAVGAPLQTAEYFVLEWDRHGVVCKAALFIEVLTAASSILNLTAVSLERLVYV